MTEVKSLVTLVSLLGVAVNGQLPDITVSSTYKSNQILPCSFPSGDGLRVHWYKERKDLAVHSYYNGQDQLDHQMDQFRGRTSLFHEQLSRGNASLLLKKVHVSDRGRYTCYTSNSRGRQESSFNLEVEAPVTKVSIVQEGDNITCSSEGIYPEPQLTWSRNKPADTRIEKTEQLLYNIRSSVRVDDEGGYTCHVRSNRSSRSATLTTARITNRLEFEITLDCPPLKSPLTSVTWRFNGRIIVHREVYVIVTEGWRDHANILHPSGSLTLQNLSPDLSGIYTCEVTNQEETHVKITDAKIAGRLEKTLLFLFIFSMSMLALFLLRFFLISFLKDRDDETKDQLQVLLAKRRKKRRRPRRKKATAGGSHVPQSDQVSKDLKETGF